jgi:hypothetical protein
MAKTGPIALALLSLACTATDAPADGRPGAGGTEASSEPAVDPSAEQPPDGGGGEQRFFD